MRWWVRALTYVGVFILGAIAMYLYLWYDVLMSLDEVWQQIYTG